MLGRCVSSGRIKPCRLRWYATGEAASRPTVELYNDTSRTIRDLLSPSKAELLELTVSPYIPRSIETTHSLSRLPPGYHFAYFPTSTSELDTLEDGYEKHFAPKHPFKRRLWTQGRLDFKGSGFSLGEWAECKEDLFKVVQSDNATDVWIERRMYSGASGNPESYKVRELRCLRYLRDIPSSKSVDIAVDKKSLERDVLLSHTFTPSRILLTRFSFLTHNFHRIHMDSEYARNIEQYPDVIMHGSLSIILILSTFSQFYESTKSPQSITQAKYVMFRPLYVNNPVTLTITSRKDGRKRAILWDNHNQKAVECIITHIP